MAYRIIVKEEAIADTLEAYLYYEDKSPGLGGKFIKALQDRYDQLSSNPQHYSFTDSRKILRDVKLKGFPYLIIYDIASEYVTVYVIHNSYKKPKLVSVKKSI